MSEHVRGKLSPSELPELAVLEAGLRNVRATFAKLGAAQQEAEEQYFANEEKVCAG